jgi:plasmid replication initiation protein
MKAKEPLPTEVIPEFLIQKNAISRAIYTCNPYTRKLIAMATSLLSIDFEKHFNTTKERTVKFTVRDFLKTLNIADGSRQREICKLAVKEAAGLTLTVFEDENTYAGITWFTRSYFSWGWDVIEMSFNPHLADILKTLRGESRLNLISLGKLQSFYSIRYYEIAMSYKGFMGQNGNKPDEWFFERTIEELRILFELQNKYKSTGMFRVKIIDTPIKELNLANVGLKIECVYTYGRYKKLEKVRFICKNCPSEVVSDEDKAYTQLQKDIEKLKKLYPDEWEKTVKKYMQSQELGFFANSELFSKINAESKTYNDLKHLLKKGNDKSTDR